VVEVVVAPAGLAAELMAAAVVVGVLTVKRHYQLLMVLLSLTSLVPAVQEGQPTVIIAELREVTLLQMQEH
jgi:hypothetical protein